MGQAHALEVIFRFSNVECFLELLRGPVILAHESRADASVVDSNKPISGVCVKGVLPVVQVTQVVFLAAKEHNC